MKKKITLLLVLLLSFTAWSQKKSKKLIGTVYNQNDQVLSNVLISKVGNEKTYKTDENGNFALNVRLKDTLIFSKKGYSQSRIPVSRSDEMVVLLNTNLLSDKSEIEGALGIKKDKDEITTAYGVIEADNLNIANSTNTVQGLQGKVSGLNVHKDEVYLRGIRSIRANNSALVVIDGVVSTYDFLQTIDYNLIESVTVHKGANGAALYGSQAANGVVIVKTKKSLSNSSNNVTQQIAANSNANKYNKRLKVNVKNTKPAYLSDLNNLNSSQEVFNKYESDKELFKSNPSYYLDMFNYFEEEGNTEYSKTVLNDIINSEDAKGEQLRAFAYRLDELNRNEEANVINNKLLNTYPNDVKSYRDLALGMADVGKSQIAFNTLSTFLDTDLGEIKGSSFNRITLHEVNNMIQNNPNLKKSDLASHNIIKTEFDLRIVIDWNRDDVNLNVKVVDPFSEIASADNAITRIGGEFSGILGLNEYVIRHAKAGDYYVVINNSEDLNDEITYVKITTFEDYGRNNEKKKITTIKLEPKKKDQVIMKVKI